MDHQSPDRIRQAIASGEHQKALELWSAYEAQLRVALEAGTLSADTLRETRELVAWSREVLLCGRARTLARLDALYVSGIYESCPK